MVATTAVLLACGATDPKEEQEPAAGGQGGQTEPDMPLYPCACGGMGGTPVGSGGAEPLGCDPGFVEDGSGDCVDVDECASAQHECDLHADCVNTPGDYHCACHDGFDGDGLTCEAIDDCDMLCDEGCDGAMSCGTLSIFVVDIGQGDATVVLGPALAGVRTALVIDAGNRYPDGGAIVEALLMQQGITAIDYVVLTHFDGDHIGGFVTVSGSTSLLWEDSECAPKRWFPTQAIFDQGTDTNNSSSSTQWRACVPAIASGQNVPHIAVAGGNAVGTELDLGGGHRATIVAGDGYVMDDPTRVASVNTPNERSIAVLVSNDDGFDFLVTGDLIGRPSGAENARVEAALAESLVARNVDVEVLRTGHHGAANASDPDFLVDIAPEVAIVSTGDNQGSSYHHPRCDTYASFETSLIGLVLQTERGNSDCADDPPIEPVVVNGTIRIDVRADEYQINNHGDFSPPNGEPTLMSTWQCTNASGC